MLQRLLKAGWLKLGKCVHTTLCTLIEENMHQISCTNMTRASGSVKFYDESSQSIEQVFFYRRKGGRYIIIVDELANVNMARLFFR